MEVSSIAVIQAILWIVVTVTFAVLVIYFVDPHTYSILSVSFDHFILKRTPRLTPAMGFKNKGNKLIKIGGAHEYLELRLKDLQETNSRKLEQYLLKEIIASISTYKTKFTGEKKNKARSKMTLRKSGYEAKKLTTFR